MKSRAASPLSGVLTFPVGIVIGFTLVVLPLQGLEVAEIVIPAQRYWQYMIDFPAQAFGFTVVFPTYERSA